MKKIIYAIVSAGLLAVPFSIQASDISLDDSYLDEVSGAYQVELSSTPDKHVNVASSDMYRYEDSGAYHHNPTHLSSGEIAEFAVFSVTTSASGPAIPGYIGNY